MAQACQQCNGTEMETNDSGGYAYCVNCGRVQEENTIVNNVEFQESGDRSHVMGQFVSANASKPYSSATRARARYGNTRESRDATLAMARRNISQVATSLKLPPIYVDKAYRLYNLALQRNFIFGRRQMHVVATCLYTICRQEKSPHLLIDFSDALRVNVYILGKSFLQFTRLLNLELPVVDPALYIHRFSARLELGEKMSAVSQTALRLVTRLKKDWIVMGRRPDGVCAAAMLIAARSQGFHKSQEEVAKIFRISVKTLRNRLNDFMSTPSAQLTVEEFHKVDSTIEFDPPAYIRNQLLESENNGVMNINLGDEATDHMQIQKESKENLTLTQTENADESDSESESNNSDTDTDTESESEEEEEGLPASAQGIGQFSSSQITKTKKEKRKGKGPKTKRRSSSIKPINPTDPNDPYGLGTASDDEAGVEIGLTEEEKERRSEVLQQVAATHATVERTQGGNIGGIDVSIPIPSRQKLKPAVNKSRKAQYLFNLYESIYEDAARIRKESEKKRLEQLVTISEEQLQKQEEEEDKRKNLLDAERADVRKEAQKAIWSHMTINHVKRLLDTKMNWDVGTTPLELQSNESGVQEGITAASTIQIDVEESGAGAGASVATRQPAIAIGSKAQTSSSSASDAATATTNSDGTTTVPVHMTTMTTEEEDLMFADTVKYDSTEKRSTSTMLKALAKKGKSSNLDISRVYVQFPDTGYVPADEEIDGYMLHEDEKKGREVVREAMYGEFMKERQKKKDEREAREVAADARARETGVSRKKGRGRPSEIGGPPEPKKKSSKINYEARDALFQVGDGDANANGASGLQGTEEGETVQPMGAEGQPLGASGKPAVGGAEDDDDSEEDYGNEYNDNDELGEYYDSEEFD